MGSDTDSAMARWRGSRNDYTYRCNTSVNNVALLVRFANMT
jgi:hypothetical protein